MLSGSRPRGSSSTPVSGKIGSVVGQLPKLAEGIGARAPHARRAAHENSSDDSRRRRAAAVSGSVGPIASKNLTSCLRAACSFHSRSRLTMVKQLVDRPSRSPAPNSAVRQVEARL